MGKGEDRRGARRRISSLRCMDGLCVLRGGSFLPLPTQQPQETEMLLAPLVPAFTSPFGRGRGGRGGAEKSPEETVDN